MATTKNYTKNYVGKGTQVEGMEIVKITLKVEELLKYQYEFNGLKLVTMEVAKTKQADKFEKTHTVYVTTVEDVKKAKK